MDEDEKPDSRTSDEAEATLAKAGAALQSALPEGTPAVLFIMLDGKHVDCLHNFGEMEHAASFVRDYLTSRDDGRPVVRSGPVVRVN